MADIQRIYQLTAKGRRALRSRRVSKAHLNHAGYLDALERAGLVDSIPMQWLVELYALGDYYPQRLSN